MKDIINNFSGEYDFLSNFYPACVEVDGLRYLSSEGAYQASKCAELHDRIPFTTVQPNVAKNMSRKINIRPDWKQVRISEMEKIVYAKFTQNPHLARYLLDTGDAVLIEGNVWHDIFWGMDLNTGEGKNNLGQILMALRQRFREEGLPPMEGQLPWQEEHSSDGICLQFRDLTQIDCEAIVHAGNKELYGNDGLDYAVHRAAGAEFTQACRALGGCGITEAKITGGFMLRAPYVLHTVGPCYGGGDDEQLLSRTYENVLKLAMENNIHSIAFPVISVGKCSYPKQLAAQVAIDTVRRWKTRHSDYGMDIIFACLDMNVYKHLSQALNERECD